MSGKEKAILSETNQRAEMEELAKRMAADDEESFRTFADLFGGRLRGWYVGKGLSQADAEDLAEECLIRVATKIRLYGPKDHGGFVAWIFTIAHHLWVDRSRKYQATQPLTEEIQVPDPARSALDIAHDVVTALEAALEKLRKRDEQIIRLRYLSGSHSFAEIGIALGISEVAARVGHSRALRRLSKILTQDPRITAFFERKRLSS